MLKLKIVTPSGVTYEENSVEEVTIPTTTGQISVLQNHIPLISVLSPGELVVHKGGQEQYLAVSGGILEVRPNSEVYIVADSAERAEHIDIERAEAAKKRAEELLAQQKNTEDTQFALIQAKIEKEMARLHVGRKSRHHKTITIQEK